MDFMKMVHAGEAASSGSRHARRAAEAEAKKKAAADLQGLSPGQAMALLKRKRKK
jgi:hypothetical protein